MAINKLTLPLIILLVILGQVGIDLYLLSFPAMSTALNVDGGLIKLSLTIFLLSMVVSQLLYDVLSDALGRRRVILPAIVLYILGLRCFCGKAEALSYINIVSHVSEPMHD